MYSGMDPLPTGNGKKQKYFDLRQGAGDPDADPLDGPTSPDKVAATYRFVRVEEGGLIILKPRVNC